MNSDSDTGERTPRWYERFNRDEIRRRWRSLKDRTRDRIGRLAVRVIVWCERDSNLVAHALREVRTAGLTKQDTGILDGTIVEPDTAYDGMIAVAALELVSLFGLQGHSGMSASITRGIVHTLFDFQPLGPLTGEDEEWSEVYTGSFQNRRCSSVFRDGAGPAYHGDHYIFREPYENTTMTFTGRHSRKVITFPYSPKHVTLDVPKDPTPEQMSAAVGAYEATENA